MDAAKDQKEKRKHPRVNVDLALEYRVSNAAKGQAGMVLNVSEGGLLLHSVNDIPVGTKLNISILFSKGFELNNIEVLAEIVRKNKYSGADRHEYQYGLKFIDIPEADRQKLKRLLMDESET